jgi:hypothetical protein
METMNAFSEGRDALDPNEITDTLEGMTITIWHLWDTTHPGDAGRLPIAEFKTDVIVSLSEAVECAKSILLQTIEFSSMPGEHHEWSIREGI